MAPTDAFVGLEPASVWTHFAAITKIPRPSKRERAISDHVLAWAEGHGYPVRTDTAGNLCVQVAAAPGRESAAVVVLQSHLDMVCERDPDSPYDPAKGRIGVVREGDWVAADGTTLGADNGIGVAMSMAAAEPGLVGHGPLELLMTIDEETGLTGAKELDPSIVSGRLLVNLDSEEDGALFVGCAGGTDTVYTFLAPKSRPAQGSVSRLVTVGGLVGGHSGMEIDKNRLNAIKALARILAAVNDHTPLRLSSIDGGNMRNAIPRDAHASVIVECDGAGPLDEIVRTTADALLRQFSGLDDGLAVRVSVPSEPPELAFSVEDSARLLRLLRAIPSGVLAMSADIPGLVETSTSLGVLSTDGETVRAVSASRSSSTEAMRDVVESLTAIAELAGVQARSEAGYPGWKPNLESAALAAVRESFEQLRGETPRVTAVHAGLECGLIGERIPDMDMISFGPEIEKAHAPGERVRIPSVARSWELLTRTLENLSS